MSDKKRPLKPKFRMFLRAPRVHGSVADYNRSALKEELRKEVTKDERESSS